MSKLTLVTGFAGSGKSKYCNSLKHSNELSHDVWARDLREKEISTWTFIKNLLDIETVNPKTIMAELLKCPIRHALYNEYFQMKFAERLVSLKSDTLVEIPYLDINIERIKRIRDMEIIWVKSDDFIGVLRHERMWSEERINSVVDMQHKFHQKFNHIIDKEIRIS